MATEMTASAEQIEGLLEAIPLPALLVGRDERVLGINARGAAILGAGITGRHFITAIRQPTVLDAVEACFASGKLQETRYLATAGKQDVTYRVTCGLVTTAQGTAALVSFEDVTPVEQASQMRRDFVANVSHELRTPLTALLGFIETLRGPARNDEVARDRFLDIMHSEATRMERLVKDLLSLSRVESEERMRPTERVDLRGLLDGVCRTLGPLAEARGVELIEVFPEEAVIIAADADQLRQVFTNLIENAVKYGGSGGEVKVTMEAKPHLAALRGPGVTVTVADKGPGIELVHIPRLTERFYRVDSHRSREMGGTGLGLAIVKHIINRHRGRLRIESEPGQGASFSVILPSS
ncbi:ATP-binding protein [Maritimibacter alkaliphilus]|uniref:ATP-binding protein n=1 Tax=Maritimibacter alkaliphilus TaxID=404236 RepID=UPI0021BD67F4|nr:ATP-binding protein [Maritimibacter alkaliphilus]